MSQAIGCACFDLIATRGWKRFWGCWARHHFLPILSVLRELLRQIASVIKQFSRERRARLPLPRPGSTSHVELLKKCWLAAHESSKSHYISATGHSSQCELKMSGSTASRRSSFKSLKTRHA